MADVSATLLGSRPPPSSPPLPCLEPRHPAFHHAAAADPFTRLPPHNSAPSAWDVTLFSDFSDVQFSSSPVRAHPDAAPHLSLAAQNSRRQQETQPALPPIHAITSRLPTESDSILFPPSITHRVDSTLRLQPLRSRPPRLVCPVLVPASITTAADNSSSAVSPAILMSAHTSSRNVARIESLLSSSPPRPRSSRRRDSNSSSLFVSPPSHRHRDARGSFDLHSLPIKQESSHIPTDQSGHSNQSLHHSQTAMPVQTRTRAAAAALSSSAPASTSRSAQSNSRKRQRAGTQKSKPSAHARVYDAFADDEDHGQSKPKKVKKLDVIDLVDKDFVVPPKAKSENLIKLTSLQCSICMDDMTNLTATHCGHLYCGECLAAALKTKPNCPICRQKIDVRGSRASKSKGVWPLVIKVKTVKRSPSTGKGKDDKT